MIDQIWINGNWMASDKAGISVSDRGFLMGDTCFETLYFNGQKVEGKIEHLQLLKHSMEVLQFPKCDFEAMQLVMDQAEDLLLAAKMHQASIRLTVSRGEGRGAVATGQPNSVLQVYELEKGRPFEPLQLKTSPIRRNETSPLTLIKAGCYGDHLAALRSATQAGGNEALMLNIQGRVAGLAMGNIIAKFGDEWVTPPVEDGVRDGFVRSWVVSNLKFKREKIVERSIEPDELITSNASAFGLNSIWGVRPIASIDGVVLKSTQLQAAF